jgi:hypothetical protein
LKQAWRETMKVLRDIPRARRETPALLGTSEGSALALTMSPPDEIVAAAFESPRPLILLQLLVRKHAYLFKDKEAGVELVARAAHAGLLDIARWGVAAFRLTEKEVEPVTTVLNYHTRGGPAVAAWFAARFRSYHADVAFSAAFSALELADAGPQFKTRSGALAAWAIKLDTLGAQRGYGMYQMMKHASHEYARLGGAGGHGAGRLKGAGRRSRMLPPPVAPARRGRALPPVAPDRRTLPPSVAPDRRTLPPPVAPTRRKRRRSGKPQRG